MTDLPPGEVRKRGRRRQPRLAPLLEYQSQYEPLPDEGERQPAEATPPALIEALAMIKAAGYRVSKPRKPKVFKRGKDRVGPTFVAKFADGTVTRMSTFSSLTMLDWNRGMRLSQAAWESRWRTRKRASRPQWQAHWSAGQDIAPVPPTIVSAHFEQDGVVLARCPNSESVP
jgi:hypothetical protein